MADRIPLYDVHTIVTGPFKGVGVVDKNTGAASKGEKEWCWVRTREHNNVAWNYDENDLECVSFWRFLFHRNPDGSFQIGNNSLWLFLAAMIGCVVLYRGVLGELGGYAWVIRVLCIAIPLVYLIYTGRQYIGKSK